MKKFILLLLGILFLATTPSQAITIFNGGLPDLLGGNETTGWVNAEDFSLTQNHTLTDAHFWSLEGYDTPSGGNPWDGTLKYYLFNDNSGQPAGSPFASGNGQNIVRTSTGRVGLSMPEYEYNFDLQAPINLSANTTYWFGLHLASDFSGMDNIVWEMTSNGFGLTSRYSLGGTFDNWGTGSMQLAFYLTEGGAAPIPDPSTMLLLGSGLIGLAGYGRKKFFKK